MIDINYGVESEKKVIIQLQKFFGNTLTELDYYDPFDFYNEKFIEQKSRRCKVDTYESTMGGMNKINKAKILNRKNINVFYFFNFTNINHSECDLFYWKRNLLEFDNHIIFKNSGKIDKNEIK